VIEVTIEKVIFGGDGLARLDQGFVVFVPFAAAGDRARMRIVERKAQHARGEIVEIIQPALTRESAPCPYYAHCGGCRYQHVTYGEELRLKQEQVREAFARVGKLPEAPVQAILPSPKPYGYRNRITVHAEGGRIGFRSVEGRELVDIRACLLARDEVNVQLTRLRESRPPEGHYSVRDSTVPRSGFFQANHELHERLRELVVDAMPDHAPVLLEAYCGGGYFTELLAPRFDRVIAIENDPRTLLDARRLPLAHVDWREADAAFALPEELAALPETLRDQAAVLVDPPREGLPVRLAEALCAYPAAHLVYVSCDPATLARDARMLSKTYRLVRVQPVDLFPRTAQIECVSVWQRVAPTTTR
jgi:23S rRNA (uracil1939-C5)-methyltransferase